MTLEDLKEGEEEIIILKRPRHGHYDEGARIDYEDNDSTRRYRHELRAINEWLASADICFDPAACDHSVDVQARRLRRNFTMGRFDRGGRLFGGFWEPLPKPVRLRGITIDGEDEGFTGFLEVGRVALCPKCTPRRDPFDLAQRHVVVARLHRRRPAVGVTLVRIVEYSAGA